MQSHASASVDTLNIPNSGSHTAEHTKIQHMLVGMGSTTLAAAVPYCGKVTQIFCNNEVVKTMEKKTSGGILESLCPSILPILSVCPEEIV